MMDFVLEAWVSSIIEAKKLGWMLGTGKPWQPREKLKLLFAGYNGTRNTGSDVRVEEMLRQIKRVRYQRTGCLARQLLRRGAIRPVNEERFTDDVVPGNKSPIPAVETVIAIVPHRKIPPGRYNQFVALDVPLNLPRPFRYHRRAVQGIADRREGIVQGVITRGGIVHHVRLIQQFPVDVDVLVDQLQMVAWQTDDPLHKVLMIGIGIFENNDVAAFQGPVRQKFLVPRARSAENELVYQQMVADQKRAFHGRGRNLECLHHKTGAKQRQNHGNQQLLHVL